MPEQLVPAISATIAGCAFLVALVGLISGQWRNSKKDTSDSAYIEAETKADIKYIRNTIDDIKNNQDRIEARLGKLENRVSKIEVAQEIPIRRIDRLEKHLGVTD